MAIVSFSCVAPVDELYETLEELMSGNSADPSNLSAIGRSTPRSRVSAAVSTSTDTTTAEAGASPALSSTSTGRRKRKEPASLPSENESSGCSPGSEDASQIHAACNSVSDLQEEQDESTQSSDSRVNPTIFHSSPLSVVFIASIISSDTNECSRSTAAILP